MIVKKVYSGVPAGFDPKRRLVTNWKKTEALDLLKLAEWTKTGLKLGACCPGRCIVFLFVINRQLKEISGKFCKQNWPLVREARYESLPQSLFLSFLESKPLERDF